MDEVLSAADLERLRVGEPFHSRKNRVFRIDLDGRICVAKVPGLGRESQMAHEFEILRKCRELGVSVPEPVMLLEDAFVMGYVSGRNVSEVFDTNRDESDIRMVDDDLMSIAGHVATWLYSFHKAFEFKYARGDSILRNFIDAPIGIVGIDLEESHEGDPVEDLGQVCAFAISTRPMFIDSKFELAKTIAGRYQSLSKDDVRSRLPGAVSAALRYYGKFRNDHVSMYEWATKIESWDEF